MLPRWQPDDELSKCSICAAPFTFLNRRHHCRRCGRLVCGPCSPHRITIPRQYIVRPPEERLWDIDDGYTRSRSSTDPSGYFDNLGGGETVRVCNPCVPDPNYGPPPQHEVPSSPPPTSRSRASTYAHDTRPTGLSSLRDVDQAERSIGEQLAPTQSHSVPSHASFPVSLSRPFERRWVPNIRTARSQALQSIPQSQRTRALSHAQRTRSDDVVTSSRQHQRSASHAVTGSNGLVHRHSTSHGPKSRDHARGEDDECPVCGTREQPFGPYGVTADRERHVEQCLRSHFAFSAGPSTRAVPGPGVEQPENPSISEMPSPSLRQRMLVYYATEKDCFDESGEPQECVICFEEFQSGDEMGRLECLCRFHRTCIRSWWATKGPGSCPTHQLHD